MATPIRLWGPDFTLAHTVDANDAIDSDSGTITLPLDHPAAKWLLTILDQPARAAYATVDTSDGRWSGQLDRFEAHRTASGDTLVSHWQTDGWPTASQPD